MYNELIISGFNNYVILLNGYIEVEFINNSKVITCLHNNVDSETLEDVESFTYLGSIIYAQGGSDSDVNMRNDKVKATFLKLKNVWKSKQLSVNQNQSENLQYERQDSSTIWNWNLETYNKYHQEGTSIYK